MGYSTSCIDTSESESLVAERISRCKNVVWYAIRSTWELRFAILWNERIIIESVIYFYRYFYKTDEFSCCYRLQHEFRQFYKNTGNKISVAHSQVSSTRFVQIIPFYKDTGYKIDNGFDDFSFFPISHQRLIPNKHFSVGVSSLHQRLAFVSILFNNSFRILL